MKLTAKQAKEKIIYFVDWDSKTVRQGNLYNFVMESAEEITSPRGVVNELFVDEVETDEGIDYVVKKWYKGGARNGNIIETFNNEEEAKDFVFRRIYESDFTKDDQRDTYYYETELEAATEMELKLRVDANYYYPE